MKFLLLRQYNVKKENLHNSHVHYVNHTQVTHMTQHHVVLYNFGISGSHLSKMRQCLCLEYFLTCYTQSLQPEPIRVEGTGLARVNPCFTESPLAYLISGFQCSHYYAYTIINNTTQNALFTFTSSIEGMTLSNFRPYLAFSLSQLAHCIQ